MVKRDWEHGDDIGARIDQPPYPVGAVIGLPRCCDRVDHVISNPFDGRVPAHVFAIKFCCQRIIGKATSKYEK